jgi:hypothetical protein
MEDGARHRIRGIRAEMTSGGPGYLAATGWAGLYNATVASDYKMLSGQRQDFTDPYVAQRDILKKSSIRERMQGGKRLFSGGSAVNVARWSDGTGAAPASETDYLVDEPETDEIVISTYAKGDSVMAFVFGRAASIGSYLKLHKLTAVIQSYASNRRKGR